MIKFFKNKKQVNKTGNFVDSNGNAVFQQNIEKQYNINNPINFDMNSITNMVANNHPLNPYYKVGIVKLSNGNMGPKSIPFTDEAIKLFPPNIKSHFNVIDERYKDVKNTRELIDKISFSDTPVEIKIKDFKYYLGDFEDPYPDDETKLNGKEVVKTYLMPQKKEIPKFEEKMRIVFDNSKLKISPINLKLTKLLSSNEYIFDNYNQKFPIQIQIKMTLLFNDDLNKIENINCNLNFKLHNEMINDSKSILLFNNFLLNVHTNSYKMTFIKDDKIFISGKINEQMKKKDIERTEHYISIIEQIIKIEKFFSIKFKIKNNIPLEDVKVINDLYNHIISTKNKLKAFDLSFDIVKNGADREQLQNLLTVPEIMITFVSKEIKYNILDIDINFDEMSEKYTNIKVRNKIELQEFIDNFDGFDDEYTFKIVFEPVKGKYLYKETNIIITENNKKKNVSLPSIL